MSRDIANWGIAVADAIAVRSTCPRRAVGCILLDSSNRILATGYNGTPRGFANCITMPCAGASKHEIIKGVKPEDACLAVHAEINALIHCKEPDSIRTVVSTLVPCFRCLKALLNTPMETLIVRDFYPNWEAYKPLLLEKQVNLIMVK